MPVVLTPADVALRVLAAFVAAALVGLNRGERGRAAGLRTTILVFMAAAFAMLLCNALLNTTGRSSTFFTQMDVMRLPLGVLTGIGFLGAGTIMRKGRSVAGLTTAATLWFVTVMGLCFGAGSYLLGVTALATAFACLWALKHLEHRLKTDQHASLVICVEESGPTDVELRALLQQNGYRIVATGLHADREARVSKHTYELLWRSKGHDRVTPTFIEELAHKPGLKMLEWTPQSLVEQSDDA